uniref:GDSL esterase/lipase At4g01130 family n=1 Tax=Cajanus cajan TaxID=3821 RepID=A0A151UF25_CAJCA
MPVLPCLIGLCHSKCDFEAIFNFGDSNSDTGGFWAAFPAQSGPFGMTYFKKPVGRASDGRLIVDFLGNTTNFIFLIMRVCLFSLISYNILPSEFGHLRKAKKEKVEGRFWFWFLIF